MKKIAILAFILLASSGVVKADDAEPIRTIQALYSHSMEMDKHFHGYNNNDLLAKFSTQDLKRLFKANDQLKDKTGELGCIEIDLMWQTNAGSDGAQLFLEQLDSRRVAVVIGATEGLESRSLVYEMKCDNGSCKINDLIFNQKNSFKKELAECLREAG